MHSAKQYRTITLRPSQHIRCYVKPCVGQSEYASRVIGLRKLRWGWETSPHSCFALGWKTEGVHPRNVSERSFGDQESRVASWRLQIGPIGRKRGTTKASCINTHANIAYVRTHAWCASAAARSCAHMRRHANERRTKQPTVHSASSLIRGSLSAVYPLHLPRLWLYLHVSCGSCGRCLWWRPGPGYPGGGLYWFLASRDDRCCYGRWRVVVHGGARVVVVGPVTWEVMPSLWLAGGHRSHAADSAECRPCVTEGRRGVDA